MRATDVETNKSPISFLHMYCFLRIFTVVTIYNALNIYNLQCLQFYCDLPYCRFEQYLQMLNPASHWLSSTGWLFATTETLLTRKDIQEL